MKNINWFALMATVFFVIGGIGNIINNKYDIGSIQIFVALIYWKLWGCD